MTPQHRDRQDASARRDRARRVGRTAGSLSVAIAWIACAAATAIRLADESSWPDTGVDLSDGLSPTFSGWLVNVALVGVRVVGRLLG